jgi:hypothetical protein
MVIELFSSGGLSRLTLVAVVDSCQLQRVNARSVLDYGNHLL